MELERDEYGRTPWVHEATITDPTGLHVQVSVVIPPAADWDESTESLEIAQMQAVAAMKHIRKIRKERQERCPF
ncbi:hypothetical protein [Actinoplanes palleronii]|uniref:Uncharacterized protein n=1 Tax=Actinoplanes palleronii TaxID=113570 RepID=A0ABQ4BJB8_9ACTN|nr:hypothetical protein [Actinoplanes palleronii]GIE70774.1 hypothetical protein Apa02nite_068820 [Actinoplanes palleronii]